MLTFAVPLPLLQTLTFWLVDHHHVIFSSFLTNLDFFLQTNKKSIKIMPIITLYQTSDHVKDALSTIPGNLYRVSSSSLTSRPTTLFDSDLIGSKHLCRKCVLTKLENLSTTKLSEIFCFPAQYITNFKKFVST